MSDWLAEARARLAGAVGDDVSVYALSPADVERILDLARIAAHDSGERINAPLLAYLVGIAHGRNPERSLDELVKEAGGS